MRSLIFLFVLFTLNVSAQITTSWTTTIPRNQLPVGATVPTISTLDYPNQRNFSIDLDAVTYDNATETTAFTAIGNAVKVVIDSNYIDDTLKLNTDFEIIGRIYIEKIERRFDNFEPNNFRDQYTAATDIFRVTGVFKWE